MTLFMLPVFGFLIGLLIISIGGGGGGCYVGILTAIFNVPPAVAASTSLATIIPTTAIGAASHIRAGNVNLRVGKIMLAGALAGAVTGSLCSGLLPESVYNKVTGIMLIVLGVQMIISRVKRARGGAVHQEAVNKTVGTAEKFKAAFYGFLGGAMSGLVGLSGSVPLIAGLTLLGCSALETVGTSVFVLVGISSVGFLMHLGIGDVDWHLVGMLVLGTTTGAFMAPMLLSRIGKDKLQKILPPVIIGLTFITGTIVLCK